MSEAAHERVAVERLELVEPRRVDKSSDRLANLERPAQIGRDDAVEVSTTVRPVDGDGGRFGRLPIPGRVGRPTSEVPNNRPAECKGMLVVERLVVDDSADAGVNTGTTEILGRDVFTGRRLH